MDDSDIDIDDLFEGGGYFLDDGTPVDPSTVPIPNLCLSCRSYGKRGEELMLCTLNRIDQQNDPEFHCGAYRLKMVKN